MDDIDFARIAPRCGGPRDAFEELCCQIVRRTTAHDEKFTRLRGAGGDGGVECFVDHADGTRDGWQAKFVFDIDPLLKQLDESLTTALKVHPSLVNYIVCFPFDLTGKTKRKGKGQHEKFEAWRNRRQDAARESGRTLTIEDCSASRIRDELLAIDPAGGMRAYFFDQTILSPQWFEQRISRAVDAAGPRYTRGLSVETGLWEWFEAFGRTPTWSDALILHLRECRKYHRDLLDAVGRTESKTGLLPPWPDDSRNEAMEAMRDLSSVLGRCEELARVTDRTRADEALHGLRHAIEKFAELEDALARDLESRHGTGRANSPGFRQFMAEYQCEFPAANLDKVREARNAIHSFADWLESPAGWLAFERVFVVTGIAGSGKTHGICDSARRRFNLGRLSCIAYGHEFRGEPDPWTRLREIQGLPPTLGEDALLDAMDSAAEASGELLVLCIDAINETKPLRYWRDRIASFAHAVLERPFLRLCVTCRSSFTPYCLPAEHGFFSAEHRGFAGVERDACQAFFDWYGLEPPIAPILQPELANPLYLRLVCETARLRRWTRLPTGWQGLANVITAFLTAKEEQFAVERETTVGAKIVSGSLVAIAREIAVTGEANVAWSRAEALIASEKPMAATLQVLAWLLRADLLIEDSPRAAENFDAESTVRPAFERLGDFLVARELLANVDSDRLDEAFEHGGSLALLMRDAEAVGQNNGVIAALSILLPERVRPGFELPTFVVDVSVRSAVLELTVGALPWRDPAGFSRASAHLLREALNTEGLSFAAMEATVGVSWQPSCIDALWLDKLLRSIPLAHRDAFWCGYLHEAYEQNGALRHLIDAGFELPLDRVETEVAERWAVMLLWFTAAADRRVKDAASRSALRVIRSCRTLPRQWCVA